MSALNDMLAAATARPTIGKVIRDWCAEHGYPQAHLAAKLRISAAHLGNIVRGDSDFPEKYLQSLPSGLRQEVARMLADQHIALARATLQSVGIHEKNVCAACGGAR